MLVGIESKQSILCPYFYVRGEIYKLRFEIILARPSKRKKLNLGNQKNDIIVVSVALQLLILVALVRALPKTLRGLKDSLILHK